MVKLKTKSDKHVIDDEKRRKSIREKEKAKLNLSLVIKEALSGKNISKPSNKKIIFSDNNDDQSNSREKINGKEKAALFDGSSSEDEEFEIKEKSQFASKKGFELLNLQSTYGNDKRFLIDERFLEDEKEESEVNTENQTEGLDEEKSKSLKILENILGKPVIPDTEKKTKKRTFEMIRYDASNKDHEKYEIKQKLEPNTQTKKRREKKNVEKSKRGHSIIEVSKEKFYEVSKEIKNSFKESEQESCPFSLLQTYGNNEIERVEDIPKDSDIFDFEKDDHKEEYVKKSVVHQNDGEKIGKNNVIKKNEILIDEKKMENKGVVAKGIWKESFFFVPDDSRYKEGLEFINKKNSEEALKATDCYDETRRKLKEILRLHMKKQMHKKDPFKNKVGGMNKKQLINSKFKNFTKRKPFKMKPGGKV